MGVPSPASGVLDLVQPDSSLGLKEFLELSSQVLEERVTSEVGAFYWTALAPEIVNSGREEQGSVS
jgi:hypothetical protein